MFDFSGWHALHHFGMFSSKLILTLALRFNLCNLLICWRSCNIFIVFWWRRKCIHGEKFNCRVEIVVRTLQCICAFTLVESHIFKYLQLKCTCRVGYMCVLISSDTYVHGIHRNGYLRTLFRIRSIQGFTSNDNRFLRRRRYSTTEKKFHCNTKFLRIIL